MGVLSEPEVPTWIANLPAEANAIAAAPVIFISVIIVVGLGIWGLLSLVYRTRLSNKDSQIELLKSRLAAYGEKLDGATPDEAKERIEKLEQQVKQLMPRTLNPEQKQALGRHLRTLGPARSIEITNEVTGGPDGKKYADDLGRLFESVGWAVTRNSCMGQTHPATGLGIALVGAIPVGIESDLIQVFQSVGLAFDSLPGGHRSAPGGQQAELALLISRPDV